MRYLLLILLNIPVVLLAILNTVTKYKMRRISLRRFTRSILFWMSLLLLLLVALPVYNYSQHDTLFNSSSLTILDIVQTTTIVYLIYVVNTLRQKVERVDKRIRDLHQEVSIRLSQK